MDRISVDWDPRPALRFLRDLEGQPDTEHQLSFIADRGDIELLQLVASFMALSVQARSVAEDVTTYLALARNILPVAGKVYTSDEPSDAAKLDRLFRDLDRSPLDE